MRDEHTNCMSSCVVLSSLKHSLGRWFCSLQVSWRRLQVLTSDVRARRQVAAWRGLRDREAAVLAALRHHLATHQQVFVTPFDMLLYPSTSMALHAW